MADENANPLTVFVADNSKMADAVIQLLAGAGIVAEAVAAPPRAESALLGSSEMVMSEEIEIRVTDPAKVAPAKELLDSAVGASLKKAIRDKRANRTGTVTAVCEDCGKSSEWPAAAMGTTDVCPHCGGYMDIPDPDDNWSDMDFGEDEDEAAEPEK